MRGLDNAMDAFWNAVAEAYPEARTGDFSPEDTMRFEEALCP